MFIREINHVKKMLLELYPLNKSTILSDTAYKQYMNGWKIAKSEILDVFIKTVTAKKIDLEVAYISELYKDNRGLYLSLHSNINNETTLFDKYTNTLASKGFVKDANAREYSVTRYLLSKICLSSNVIYKNGAEFVKDHNVKLCDVINGINAKFKESKFKSPYKSMNDGYYDFVMACITNINYMFSSKHDVFLKYFINRAMMKTTNNESIGKLKSYLPIMLELPTAPNVQYFKKNILGKNYTYLESFIVSLANKDGIDDDTYYYKIIKEAREKTNNCEFGLTNVIAHILWENLILDEQCRVIKMAGKYSKIERESVFS